MSLSSHPKPTYAIEEVNDQTVGQTLCINIFESGKWCKVNDTKKNLKVNYNLKFIRFITIVIKSLFILSEIN